MKQINEIHTKIGEGGRVNIPSSLRSQLGLAVGDEVIIRIQDDNLQITTAEKSLLKLQNLVKKNKGEISLLDELFKMRREEAKNE